MDEVFQCKNTPLVQTASDVLLNAHLSYEYWLKEQFQIYDQVSFAIRSKDTLQML